MCRQQNLVLACSSSMEWDISFTITMSLSPRRIFESSFAISRISPLDQLIKLVHTDRIIFALA